MKNQSTRRRKRRKRKGDILVAVMMNIIKKERRDIIDHQIHTQIAKMIKNQQERGRNTLGNIAQI